MQYSALICQFNIRIAKHLAQQSPKKILAWIAFEARNLFAVYHQYEGGRKEKAALEFQIIGSVRANIHAAQGCRLTLGGLWINR